MNYQVEIKCHRVYDWELGKCVVIDKIIGNINIYDKLPARYKEDFPFHKSDTLKVGSIIPIEKIDKIINEIETASALLIEMEKEKDEWENDKTTHIKSSNYTKVIITGG